MEDLTQVFINFTDNTTRWFANESLITRGQNLHKSVNVISGKSFDKILTTLDEISNLSTSKIINIELDNFIYTVNVDNIKEIVFSKNKGVGENDGGDIVIGTPPNVNDGPR